MSALYFIGIDPGVSGGAAMLNHHGQIHDAVKFKSMTLHDIAETLDDWRDRAEPGEVVAMIEKVHAMPRQGVTSSFNFGRNFGNLEAYLVALKIPFDYVAPNKWQKALGCQTKGDKNVSKARAQRQWPGIKMTHAIADCLLIAEFCRTTSK